MGRLIINWPFAKQRVVESHDGTIHYVFKKIDDAFPFYFGESKTSATAAVDALKKVKGKIDAKHEKTVSNILVVLSDKNGTMQMHLRAAYAVYQASPSKNSLDELRRSIEDLRTNENLLRAAEAKTQALLAIISASATGGGSELVGRLLQEILVELTEPEALAGSMSRVTKNSEEWQQIA